MKLNILTNILYNKKQEYFINKIKEAQWTILKHKKKIILQQGTPASKNIR